MERTFRKPIFPASGVPRFSSVRFRNLRLHPEMGERAMHQAVQHAAGARFRADVSMAAGYHGFHFLRRIGGTAPERFRQMAHGVQVVVPVSEDGRMDGKHTEP